MSNIYFKFKQFTVYQDRCAMKVGTDGTLLGAWTNVSKSRSILDIGTGTGLIALMLAQRSSDAHITAIDIDMDSVAQAKSNVALSSWSSRISVFCSSLQNFVVDGFDTIVSNPPYFVNSLKCPNEHRTLARHTASLSYKDLFDGVTKMLSDDGEFSVIVPFDSCEEMNSEAALAGMFLSRSFAVRSVPSKNIRRYLLSYKKHLSEQIDEADVCIEDEYHNRSEWYKKMTEEFYL
jgi:tRNA1Val (adenine37-N6)-methyltransferase